MFILNDYLNDQFRADDRFYMENILSKFNTLRITYVFFTFCYLFFRKGF